MGGMPRWLPGDGLGWLLLVFGAVSLGNAAWMLADPLRWYHELPAGVPDFGPFNPHFVRDIGVAFVAMAVAFGWAAFVPRWRPPLVAVGTVFFAGHALLHAFDTLRGALERDHWLLDPPAVYLPAVILVPVAVRLVRGAPREPAH